MLSIIAQTDPVVAMQSLSLDSLALKDFLLGFFIALALRRGRIEQIIDRALPMAQVGDDSDGEQKSITVDK